MDNSILLNNQLRLLDLQLSKKLKSYGGQTFESLNIKWDRNLNDEDLTMFICNYFFENEIVFPKLKAKIIDREINTIKDFADLADEIIDNLDAKILLNN